MMATKFALLIVVASLAVFQTYAHNEPLEDVFMFCDACRTGATNWDEYCPMFATPVCDGTHAHNVTGEYFCAVCDDGEGGFDFSGDACVATTRMNADAVCPPGFPLSDFSDELCPKCTSSIPDWENMGCLAFIDDVICGNFSIIYKDFCREECDGGAANGTATCHDVIKGTADDICLYNGMEDEVEALSGLYWVGDNMGALAEMNMTSQSTAGGSVIYGVQAPLISAQSGLDGNYVKFYSRPSWANAFPDEQHWVFYTAGSRLVYTSADEFYYTTPDRVPTTYTFLDHETMYDGDDPDGGEPPVDGYALNYWGLDYIQDEITRTVDNTTSTQHIEAFYVVAYDGAAIVSRKFVMWEPLHQFSVLIERVLDIPSGLARDLEIDRVNRFMYWTELYGGVYRIALGEYGETLDYTNAERLVATTRAYGLALTKYMMWWTAGEELWRGDLQAGWQEKVATISGAVELFDIVVHESIENRVDGTPNHDADPRGLVFISDRLGQAIYQCQKDGDYLGKFFDTSDLGVYPRGMDVGYRAGEAAASSIVPSAILFAVSAAIAAVLSYRA